MVLSAPMAIIQRHRGKKGDFMNSNQKGKRGERELANLLREHGFEEARRGQQYNGIEGQDVVGIPRLHIECKRVEDLNIYNAMTQSMNDAASEEIPFNEDEFAVVMHRKNRKKWLVTMRFLDWRELFKAKHGISKYEQVSFSDVFVYEEYSNIIHAYSKKTKRLNLYKEIKSLQDMGKNLPIVFAHTNGDCYFLVTMLFTDWIEFHKEWIK